MAWTTPKTNFAPGDILTAAQMNAIGNNEQAGHGLVAALPVSPSDGDSTYYQTSGMATNGQVWTFRYRSASGSSYKWEFVGGSSLSSATAGDAGTLTSTTYTTFTNPATITLPIAGDYMVTFGAEILNTTNGAQTFLALSGAGITAADGNATTLITRQPSGANTSRVAASRTVLATALTTASALTMQYRVDSGDADIVRCFLALIPVRVG